MASQVRYFVRFIGSVGIYRGGDEVALSADEYAREQHRRPGPLVELMWEQHEELGQDGRVVPASVKRVGPSLPPPEEKPKAKAEPTEPEPEVKAEKPSKKKG